VCGHFPSHIRTVTPPSSCSLLFLLATASSETLAAALLLELDADDPFAASLPESGHRSLSSPTRDIFFPAPP
jgi:hypothetical protein